LVVFEKPVPVMAISVVPQGEDAVMSLLMAGPSTWAVSSPGFFYVSLLAPLA